MLHPRRFAPALILAALLALPVAAGDLDRFLGEVNISAHADLGAFRADLSAQFGVPVPKIDELLHKLPTPGDVYMSLRIGQLAKRPYPVVVAEYQRHQGQGWGVIAKNLGIKPGSAEFHALKQGNFGKNKNTAKSQGHSKGKGKR